MKKILILGSVILIIAAISGCFLFEKTGTVSLKLTDAPLLIDGKTVATINVTITEILVSQGSCDNEIPEDETVEIIGEIVDPADKDGDAEWTVINAESQEFDLMTLQDGVTALIGTTELATGHYNQVRLILAQDNTITFVDDTNVYDLNIPSSTESGVKLVGGFRIVEDADTVITLDFDAQASVTYVGGEYILQPTIKIIKVDKPQSQFNN